MPLELNIAGGELYDESKQAFITVKPCAIRLEHSLISVSNWEMKWHKPFLDTEKTPAETLDYIKCMTITQGVDPNVYLLLTSDDYKLIEDYITDPMTATWFNENNTKKKKKVITNEVIYSWMVSLQIPLEWERRHLNRLMTLIRVCSETNSPPKKMGKHDLMRRNASLNAARRAALHSKG